MDDEELVRDVAEVMFETLGHRVEFAMNGAEAIHKYREALSLGRRFDIVILDLTIRGGMGGEETMERLLEMDPDVKAVVSSGYAESSAICEYRKYGFKARLAKALSGRNITQHLARISWIDHAAWTGPRSCRRLCRPMHRFAVKQPGT